MNAVLAMVDEGVRLYSRQPRMPADVVEDRHVVVHGDLSAYGRWCRNKYTPGTCESIEGRFEETGAREAKQPQIALPENPRLRQIDRVVRHLRMWMPAHGEAIRMYYVGAMRRDKRLGIQYEPASPKTICRVLNVRYETFAPFMATARDAVLNLLRRYGA